MKVLHFIWSANFGGIEKIVIDLASQQIQSGNVDATILIGCNKGQFLHVIKEKEIPNIIAGIKNGYHITPGLISKLTEIIKGYDLIHIHTFNLPVMMAAVRSGVKIIYTVHGNFNYGKKIRINDRINNLLKSYYLNKCVNFITFNSEWSKQEAIAKFQLKLNLKFTVVKNGIDIKPNNVSNQTPSDIINRISSEKFIVGTIARFNKSKRLEMLIEAFALFSKNKRDTQLLLVGDGVERPHLETLVEKLDIENSTTFSGYQPNVLPYETAMSICVFPFENEAFGLVVLEAFALGKPVIIFKDSGGMKEIFELEFQSDIVNNIEELADRINFYYNNRMRIDNASIERRKEIATSYTLSEMERTYLTCYKQVLSGI